MQFFFKKYKPFYIFLNKIVNHSRKIFYTQKLQTLFIQFCMNKMMNPSYVNLYGQNCKLLMQFFSQIVIFFSMKYDYSCLSCTENRLNCDYNLLFLYNVSVIFFIILLHVEHKHRKNKPFALN